MFCCMQLAIDLDLHFLEVTCHEGPLFFQLVVVQWRWPLDEAIPGEYIEGPQQIKQNQVLMNYADGYIYM
jgi:hypothetical protein